MWILVVEDDRDLADSLQTGLEETGHTVEVAHDGLEGEDLAMINDYDVIIMDRLMPGQEGMQLTQRLRQAGVGTPVLMLTAMVEVDDRVEALDAGADDYLTKPFAFEELFARVRALARRATVLKPSDILEVGVLRIDTRRRSITTAQGESMVLRGKEYALFEGNYPSVEPKCDIAVSPQVLIFLVVKELRTRHPRSCSRPKPTTASSISSGSFPRTRRAAST